MHKVPIVFTRNTLPTRGIIVNHVTLVVCTMKFMVVTMGFFTKWVEVEALDMITVNIITKFLWKVVTC